MSPTNFCASSYRFRDINYFNFELQKVDQGHRVQFFTITPFDRKCQNPQNIFAFALTVSEILKFLIIYLKKSRSRSRSTIFAMTPYDGKYRNLQKTHTHFTVSMTRANDCNTHRDTHRQT